MIIMTFCQLAMKENKEGGTIYISRKIRDSGKGVPGLRKSPVPILAFFHLPAQDKWPFLNLVFLNYKMGLKCLFHKVLWRLYMIIFINCLALYLVQTKSSINNQWDKERRRYCGNRCPVGFKRMVFVEVALSYSITFWQRGDATPHQSKPCTSVLKLNMKCPTPPSFWSWPSLTSFSFLFALSSWFRLWF